MGYRASVPGLFFISALVFAVSANAQQAPAGSLTDLVNSGQFDFNRLERLAAYANQATYNQLVAKGCDPTQRIASAGCAGNTFLVFSNVRELVETANVLLNREGSPQYSLGLDNEQLGFALRWTAAEELAAQGSASTEFSHTQIASVMTRLTALRFGATGFTVNGMPLSSRGQALAMRDPPTRGGGASADDDAGSIAAKWGGFLNGSFSWGDRKPTDLEDAFAFDNREASLGADYRFNSHLVVGAMAGYAKQRIDFDSSQSVVDGGIESKGFGVTLYGLYDWDGPYVNATLGFQRLSIDSIRVITYPSFNINVPAVNATARGSTHSSNWIATFNAGWALGKRAFGFEPYLRTEYRHISINGFRESSVNNSGTTDAGQPSGFDFDIDSQSIKSFDTGAGIRMQYTFTPSFGVIVPFINGEYHHNFDDKTYSTQASYNGLGAGGGAPTFDLPADAVDSDFFTFSGGLSVVLRHGWQAFAQYQTVEGLQYIKNHAITAGIRAEF